MILYISEQSATDDSHSIGSFTKKDRYTLTEQTSTLIEQSQCFQGSIRADSSKLGGVTFVNDLWSDSVVAKVLTCLPFLGRGINSK